MDGHPEQLIHHQLSVRDLKKMFKNGRMSVESAPRHDGKGAGVANITNLV
jgi:hypothetical protein